FSQPAPFLSCRPRSPKARAGSRSPRPPLNIEKEYFRDICRRAMFLRYASRPACAAEVQARRGGFGGRGGAARPKRRFVNSSLVCFRATERGTHLWPPRAPRSRNSVTARSRLGLLANYNESAHVTRMDDEQPIPLADACKLYPRARLTVSTLRAEAARGRLDIFRLVRRVSAARLARRERTDKCQEAARPGPSTSIQPAVIGLSATARASSALDSANTTVSELRSASLNTSARNGSPNAAPIR